MYSQYYTSRTDAYRMHFCPIGAKDTRPRVTKKDNERCHFFHRHSRRRLLKEDEKMALFVRTGTLGVKEEDE